MKEFLLYGEYVAILAMDLDSLTRTDNPTIIFPIMAERTLHGLDFDFRNEWIYYSQENKLLRTTRNGTGMI